MTGTSFIAIFGLWLPFPVLYTLAKLYMTLNEKTTNWCFTRFFHKNTNLRLAKIQEQGKNNLMFKSYYAKVIKTAVVLGL